MQIFQKPLSQSEMLMKTARKWDKWVVQKAMSILNAFMKNKDEKKPDEFGLFFFVYRYLHIQCANI